MLLILLSLASVEGLVFEAVNYKNNVNREINYAYDKNVSNKIEKVEMDTQQKIINQQKVIQVEKLKYNMIKNNGINIILGENPRVSWYQANTIIETLMNVKTVLKAKSNIDISIPLSLAIIKTESTFENQRENWATAKGYMQMTNIAVSSVCKDWNEPVSNYNMNNIYDNLLLGNYYFYKNLNDLRGDVESALVCYNQGYGNLWSGVVASRGDNSSYMSKVLNKSYEYEQKLYSGLDF